MTDRFRPVDPFTAEPDTLETASLRVKAEAEAALDLAALEAGADEKTLGPYILEGHLARGGMGDVWKARREGPGGYVYHVALKQLHPHLLKNIEQQRMFLREARLSSRLYHPNIVPVIDLSHEGGVPYLVMELIEGVDLRRLASRGEALGEPIPPALAGYVIHQALWALEAAHSLTDERGDPAPLIHRDISPENVLIGRYGEVRVTDFGIAKQLRVGEDLTRVGVIKGKFAYMSPEQLRGQEIDGRADLYAVGISMYELLCGRRPYEANGLRDALKNSERPPPHPLELRPNLPRALADLAMLWRHPDRNLRGESVRAARRELAELLDKLLRGVPNVALARWVAAITSEEVSGLEVKNTVLLSSVPGCAKCGGKLRARETTGGVVMDECRDCHGVWLDSHELVRILGAEVSFTGESEEAAPEQSPLDDVVGDCPRCHQRLKVHQVPGEHSFHVEQCGRCKGIWFDAGELERFVVRDVAAMVRQVGGLDL